VNRVFTRMSLAGYSSIGLVATRARLRLAGRKKSLG
jgi:hypothetical protein